MTTNQASSSPFLAGIVFLLTSTVLSAAPLPERVERDDEETLEEWVVFPQSARLTKDQAAFVSRFLAKTIETRHPQLEFKGYRTGNGLRYGVKSGSKVADAWSLNAALERLPGALGAMPVPSSTARLKARMKQLARGGLESRAAGLIVRYREGMQKKARAGGVLDATELRAMSDIVGHKVSRSRPMARGSLVLDFERDTDIHSAELASRRLEMHPDIEFASPNGYATAQLDSTDPLFSRQWNLTSPVSGINAPQAWNITTGHPQAVIAVVDTGILAHPDFANRLLFGYDFISDAASAQDGDGRDANAIDSGDYRAPGTCGPGDIGRTSTWHGTAVSGIIASSGSNGIGIAGVNWQSYILPVRVLGRCGGLDSDILDGLYWAAGYPVTGVPDNPVPAWVINMSLGGPGNCLLEKGAYQVAIFEALANGATVVVAAGNQGESALTRVPASCIGTVKVAAIGPDGDRTPYTNLSQAIEIAAPGGNLALGSEAGILTTFATGLNTDPGSPAWASGQGTSFAAPHVSGVASLILAVRPELTVAQVREIIRATATPFPAGSHCATSKSCGLGIVDAGKAVAAARQEVQPFNFSDMWWVPDESGWGLNLQQQGDLLFGTWFTYDSEGQPSWFFMSDIQRVSQDYFIGDIYRSTGTPLNQINGSPALRQVTKVGTALLAFFGIGISVNPNLDFDSAIFYYEVGDVAAAKPVQRYFFSKPTLCRFSTASRAASKNYQDLWWKRDESGWGLNVTHQGDTLFATWFTYADGGQNTWLYSNLDKTGERTYFGEIYRASGTPFDQIEFEPALLFVRTVGQITLTFTDGERGRMDYVVNGVAGSKPIERYLFSSPTSVCESIQ